MKSPYLIESYNVLHTLTEELDKMERKGYLNNLGLTVLEVYRMVLRRMPFNDTVAELLMDEDIAEELHVNRKFHDVAKLEFWLQSQRVKEQK